MRPKGRIPPASLDVNRLGWRGIWVPTTALATLLVLDGSMEVFLDETWDTYVLLAHFLLLGLVTAGTFLFLRRIFTTIQRRDEALRHHENARTRQARIDAAFSELHGLLISSSSLLTLTESVLDHARSLTESDHGYVTHADRAPGDVVAFPKGDTMTAVGIIPPGTTRVEFHRTPPSQLPCPFGFPVSGEKPFYTNSPTTHPAFLGLPDRSTPLTRFLSVPVRLDGDLAGHISLANSARHYTEDDLNVVGRLAAHYAQAIQRKRSEEELASLARFPSENPHPVMRLGPDGTILYANAASAGLLETWDTAVGRAAPAPWPDIVRDALATGATKAQDVQCGTRSYAFSSVPVANGNYVNLYGRDITDRTRAEEALHKAHNELERRVHERTETLYVTNRRLTREIVERRRAENALQAMFDNVPVGLYRTTPAGKFLDANPALVAILGFPSKDALLAADVVDLYAHIEDRRRWREQIERDGMVPGFEIEIHRHDGELIWVQHSSRAIRDADGSVLYYEGGVQDITDIKRVEAALRENEALLRSVLETLPVGVWITDQHGRVLEGNPAAKQIWAGARYGAEEYADYRGRWASTGKLIEPDEWAGARAIRGETSLAEEIEIECFDGTHKIILNSAIPLRDARGEISGALIVNEDVTVIKQAEDQLRAVSARLESVREEERTRLAREIHDELGQLLTGLKLDLFWVATKLPITEAALREKIRSMSSLVDNTIKSVRRMATELRPGILDDLGLTAAIEWQLQEFHVRTGIRCAFTAKTRDAIEDQEHRTSLFRILQEALTNVARHANATEVIVALTETDHAFELSVQDNGRGITNGEIANRKSLGLQGIRERVRLLGGDVTIVGRPGVGTTVLVRVPVDRPAEPSRTTAPLGPPQSRVESSHDSHPDRR